LTESFGYLNLWKETEIDVAQYQWAAIESKTYQVNDSRLMELV